MEDISAKKTEELLLDILELFTLEDTRNLGYSQIKKYFNIDPKDIIFNADKFHMYLTNPEVDLLAKKVCEKNNNYTINNSVLVEREKTRYIYYPLKKNNE